MALRQIALRNSVKNNDSRTTDINYVETNRVYPDVHHYKRILLSCLFEIAMKPRGSNQEGQVLFCAFMVKDKISPLSSLVLTMLESQVG